MSVSVREAANSSVSATNHRGSGANVACVAGEMTVYVWQQAEMQSPFCGNASVSESPVSGPSARPDPEGWPQQPWEAHAPTPVMRNAAISRRGMNPLMPDRRENIISRL